MHSAGPAALGSWHNPSPPGIYNLVVVGGGSTGIAAAVEGARLGARVALVERERLGGSGVERVALAESLGHAKRRHDEHADLAALAAEAARLAAARRRLVTPWHLTGHGIDVYLGEARFTGPQTVDAAGVRLDFVKAVVATGSQPPLAPPEVFADPPMVAPEKLFGQATLPPCLAIVGDGPAACDWAHVLRRFGVDVHLLTASPALLPQFEPWAAEQVAAGLARDGVRLHFSTHVVSAAKAGRAKALVSDCAGKKQELIVDEIVLLMRQFPNIESLELDRAGISSDESGMLVDRGLRTSNRRVLAAGSAGQRASGFLGGRDRQASQAIGRWCARAALLGFAGTPPTSQAEVLFTVPQVARAGLSLREAQRRGMTLDIHRDVIEQSGQALQVEFLTRGASRVVGATVVGDDAARIAPQLAELVARRATLRACRAALGGESQGADIGGQPPVRPGPASPLRRRLLKGWFRRQRSRPVRAS